MHTIFSDGTWTPEQLIDYLVSEQFGLGAITDHDRVDTASELQQLAAEKQLPLLTAVEMSTSWRDEPTDVLCYGFDPDSRSIILLTRLSKWSCIGNMLRPIGY
jgi:predicted metal-dependent phosphoesterase TrpH